MGILDIIVCATALGYVFISERLACRERQNLIRKLWKGDKIMATLQEVLDKVEGLKTTLSSVDSKLDDARNLITELKGQLEGQPDVQAQLEQISAALSEAQATANSVLTEADELTPEAPAPAPSEEEEPAPTE